MAAPKAAEPVKLIVALLWADEAACQRATAAMEEIWGAVDHVGADRLFDVTDYYQEEMGAPLTRRIVSFGALVDPQTLAVMKCRANRIESALAPEGRRRVNLDVGYLDHSKIVLASAKYAGQKIYIGDGIYADLMGRFRGGRYEPFEWTFPDFRDGRYDPELLAIRRLYLNQLRARPQT